MPYTVPASVEQLPVITNYAYHPQDPTAQNYMGRTYQVRKTVLFLHLHMKTTICQDRLKTNTNEIS